MILTGAEILRQRQLGNIKIQPFNLNLLNPNSYNVRLGNIIQYYATLGRPLDPKKSHDVIEEEIGPNGFIINPGTIYLASTLEHTETDCHVPMIEGRSSLGRLGLLVHVTAGFGDIGFRGNWTLELAAIQPVRVYAGMEIAQIYYHTVSGEIKQRYAGKYQDSDGVVASKAFEDYSKPKSL